MRQANQKFRVDRWKKKLPGDSDLDYIIERFPDGLGRSNLTSIAEEAAKNRNAEHYRRLFLASMIWGFGGDREDTIDNRGPWRTQQITRNANPDFNEILKYASDVMLEGRIGEAYDLFKKVKWCGPAFFTKYLYFLGRGADKCRYPLILDTKVAKWLETLLGKDKLRQFVRVERNKKQEISSVLRGVGEEYEKYLDLMREWARKLGCAPDDIECFLYSTRLDSLDH
jgi:hypothetical protein